MECDKLEYVVRVKMFIYISTRSMIVFCSFFHRHNINSWNILSSNFQAITLQYTSLTSFLDEVASHLEGVILHVRQFDVEVVEGTLVHLVNFVGRWDIVVQHLSTFGKHLTNWKNNEQYKIISLQSNSVITIMVITNTRL